jgi:hypothetical protein
MLKRATARPILCILVLGLTCNLPLAAQKLHNEARDKLAQQIKSDFEQLTSPDGNIFEQAIKNADAINDADIQQWRDRERTLIDSVATILPFMTWEEVQTLAFTARNQILDVSRDVDPKTQVPLDGITAQLKKVQKEEKAIQDELKPFEANNEEKGSQEEPKPSDAADKGLLAGVQQLVSDLKKTLDDGGPLNLNPKDLEKLQTKISALPKDFSNLKKIVDGLQVPQGLNKLILQTKLLLLQNEEARLQLRQTHFKERQAKLADFQSHVGNYAGGSKKTREKKSFEDALKGNLTDNVKNFDEEQLKQILAYEEKINKELQTEQAKPIKTCEDLNNASKDPNRKEVLKDAFGSFWQVIDEICGAAYTRTQTVADSLKDLAQQAQAKGGSGSEQELVKVLTKLSLVLDLLASRYDLLVEQTNLSQDELIFHIRMMRLNVQEQEVLLHSGITGLATYEAGGIKPQDVANIVSMAQALAQAAIAARVK